MSDPRPDRRGGRPICVTLRRLRYFVAVAERLSFTGAAEVVHVSQPSLSAQVRALGPGLGVELGRRTTRRIELTAPDACCTRTPSACSPTSTARSRGPGARTRRVARPSGSPTPRAPIRRPPAHPGRARGEWHSGRGPGRAAPGAEPAHERAAPGAADGDPVAPPPGVRRFRGGGLGARPRRDARDGVGRRRRRVARVGGDAPTHPGRPGAAVGYVEAVATRPRPARRRARVARDGGRRGRDPRRLRHRRPRRDRHGRPPLPAARLGSAGRAGCPPSPPPGRSGRPTTRACTSCPSPSPRTSRPSSPATGATETAVGPRARRVSVPRRASGVARGACRRGHGRWDRAGT